MVYCSEEGLIVFWKALVTYVILMVRWNVEAMEIIILIVGSASTGEEEW